jgi:hypothetical protein
VIFFTADNAIGEGRGGGRKRSNDAHGSSPKMESRDAPSLCAPDRSTIRNGAPARGAMCQRLLAVPASCRQLTQEGEWSALGIVLVEGRERPFCLKGTIARGRSPPRKNPFFADQNSNTRGIGVQPQQSRATSEGLGAQPPRKTLYFFNPIGLQQLIPTGRECKAEATVERKRYWQCECASSGSVSAASPSGPVIRGRLCQFVGV